jgi:hypothetical protein
MKVECAKKRGLFGFKLLFEDVADILYRLYFEVGTAGYVFNVGAEYGLRRIVASVAKLVDNPCFDFVAELEEFYVFFLNHVFAVHVNFVVVELAGEANVGSAPANGQ